MASPPYPTLPARSLVGPAAAELARRLELELAPGVGVVAIARRETLRGRWAAPRARPARRAQRLLAARAGPSCTRRPVAPAVLEVSPPVYVVPAAGECRPRLALFSRVVAPAQCNSGLAEPSHVVLGGDGLIAAEFNFSAPRMSVLERLLREKLDLTFASARICRATSSSSSIASTTSTSSSSLSCRRPSSRGNSVIPAGSAMR